MTDWFVGEIRIVAGTYAPVGWALCDGRSLSISQYPTLYSLIGTTYGGDGQTTFMLPDLRGRSAVHVGTVGGVPHGLGQSGGAESVLLSIGQMPTHTHAPATAGTASATGPAQALWAPQASYAYSDAAPTAPLPGDALLPAGSNQPHDNMPPFVTVSYIIALDGIFPTQD
jgi:microcystin-dependent protein